MNHIYLDQNKWIDMAWAATGASKGQRYLDVLTLAQAGVERGSVSFPLSSIHYLETSNRRPYSARLDLAKTMATLSRFHAIAPLTVLLPPEIDTALQRVFGRPLTVRQAPSFGDGVGFAMNQPVPAFRVPKDLPVDAEYRRQFERFASQQTEWVMLAGLPEEAGVDERHFDQIQRNVNCELATEQERLRQTRRDGNWHVGERSKRLFKAIAFASWKDELDEALQRAGLTWADVTSLGDVGMTELVEDIPIVHVSSELQRLREAANIAPWSANDLNDMFFLMVAIVYCEIVVTEKQWVDLAKRSKLDERYETVILSDLADLSTHLAV